MIVGGIKNRFDFNVATSGLILGVVLNETANQGAIVFYLIHLTRVSCCGSNAMHDTSISSMTGRTMGSSIVFVNTL